MSLVPSGDAATPLLDAEAIHQQPGELRSLAGLLVLEINEHVPARCGIARDRVRPAPDVVRLISLVAQAEVRVIPRYAYRRREFLAVRDADGEVARRQPREDLVVEPGGIA